MQNIPPKGIVLILIGTGKRMLGELDADIDLQLFETKSYPSGLITSKYTIT